jgi:hypothetical protein
MSLTDFPADDVMQLVHRENLKQDIIRDAAELSPARLLERHPVATVAIAASAGIVIAQASGPMGGALGSAMKLAAKYLMPVAIGWLTTSATDESSGDGSAAPSTAESAA